MYVTWSGENGNRSMKYLPFNCFWYKVQPGDTLSMIASAHVGPQEILEGMKMILQLNPFVLEPNNLYEGDFLVIPNKPHIEYGNVANSDPRWVIQDWIVNLPMQQQVALFMPIRGPDNIRSKHECSDVLYLYRASIMKDAFKGRELTSADETVDFLSLKLMKKDTVWKTAIKLYFDNIDELPRHFTSHLRRATCILNYKHPNVAIRTMWTYFYIATCREANLEPETEQMLDQRLNDNNRKGWDGYV